MQPNVTIILPVYNVEPYLRQCLDSVVNQTMREIQIICVNDGSTDGSPAILEEYAAKDPRIMVINQENQGGGSARNAAFPHIKGKYTYFVDSDDWIELTLCEKTVAVAEKENADMTFFFRYGFRKQTPPLQRFLETHDIHEVTFDILVANVSPWSKLFKSDFILHNNLRFPQYPRSITSHDRPFHWEAILCHPKFAVVREYLYHYRENLTSLSHKKTIQIFRYRPVFEIIKNTLDERNLFEKHAETYYREKLKFYYYLFLKPWTPKAEKPRAKEMLKELLAKAETDYRKFDFAAFYGISRSESFVINCFCRWIKDGNIVSGMIYYLLTTANQIKKRFFGEGVRS